MPDVVVAVPYILTQADDVLYFKSGFHAPTMYFNYIRLQNERIIQLICSCDKSPVEYFTQTMTLVKTLKPFRTEISIITVPNVFI